MSIEEQRTKKNPISVKNKRPIKFYTVEKSFFFLIVKNG